MRLLALSVAIVTLTGCQADPTSLEAPRDRSEVSPSALQQGGPSPTMTEEGCQLTPGCWDETGIDGNVTGGPVVNFNLGPDPSPSAVGLWIGMGATDCYRNFGASGAEDADYDLLADECEYRLAYMFRPQMMINPQDGCAGGEPYWAARYFDDPAHHGFGQFVRIAYLPAYYRDCGSGPHRGDSEMIVIRVGYNNTTQHWELVEAFLSAHFMGANDNSRVYAWNALTYVIWPLRGYPIVWVAKGKHANYAAQGCGSLFSYSTDTCAGNVNAGRFAVYQSHNVGGYNHKLVNCTASQNTLYAFNDRLECFLTAGRRFRGWQIAGTGDATDYNLILSSWAYECFAWNGTDCYYGPYGSIY